MQDELRIKTNSKPEVSESPENNFETLNDKHNEIPVMLKNTSYTMVSELNPETPASKIGLQ